MRTLRLLPIVLVVLAIVAGFLAQELLGVDRDVAQVAKLEIDSKAVGKRLETTVVIPAQRGAGRRPLLVFLHGRSGDNNSELDDAFFSALASVGAEAPLVAFPDGGDHSYWHDRAEHERIRARAAVGAGDQQADCARGDMDHVVPAVDVEDAQHGVARGAVAAAEAGVVEEADDPGDGERRADDQREDLGR